VFSPQLHLAKAFNGGENLYSYSISSRGKNTLKNSGRTSKRAHNRLLNYKRVHGAVLLDEDFSPDGFLSNQTQCFEKSREAGRRGRDSAL